MPSVGTTSMTPLAHQRPHRGLAEASPESLSATDAHGRTALMRGIVGSLTPSRSSRRLPAQRRLVRRQDRSGRALAQAVHGGALVELGAAVDAARERNRARRGPLQGRVRRGLCQRQARQGPDAAPHRALPARLEGEREATPDATPPMPPLPWVTYAESSGKATEAAAETAAPKPVSEDEPAIAELGADDYIFDDAIPHGGRRHGQEQ